MPIDEKRLDEIEAGDLRTEAEHMALCRLARLGLWATEHGIPALREIEGKKNMTRLADCCVDRSCHINNDSGQCSFQTGVHYGNADRAADASEALSKLPSEPEQKEE